MEYWSAVLQDGLISVPAVVVPVQAGGGFIEEEQARTRENLESNAETAFLTPTESPQVPIADMGVGAFLQTHLLNGVVHDLSLLRSCDQRMRRRQTQIRRIVQILLHCQSCYQIIRLCHICLQAKQAHKELILDDDDDSFPSLPFPCEKIA